MSAGIRDIERIRMAKTKTPMPSQKIEERIRNYEELSFGYTQGQAIEEASRCLKCPARYCAETCPIHNRVPEFIAKVKDGDFSGAYAELAAVNPMPEVCGRVCAQEKQCERNCTRGLKGQPVAIGRLERFVADWHREHESGSYPKLSETGKRIAIIGSGPSGLTAAELLAVAGHSVTVFERNDRIGGLMIYGIPNMKLAKEVLRHKVQELAALGVSFSVGTEIAKDYAASALLTGYDAVLLCCGASKPRDVNVPGRDAEGVCFAVDYLTASTKALLDAEFTGLSTISTKGKDVVVVGGGDTGCDCVATAIRQGCRSVIQLEMMPKETDERVRNIPWTEFPVAVKTDYGQEEAIYLYGQDPRRFLTTVKELIVDKNGRLAGVKTVMLETTYENLKMELVEKPGSEEILDCQMLIIAAGFTGSQEYIAEAMGVRLNASGNINTPNDSHRTTNEKVFVAGDMRCGQSAAVKAIVDGLCAAREILAYLAEAGE